MTKMISVSPIVKKNPIKERVISTVSYRLGKHLKNRN